MGNVKLGEKVPMKNGVAHDIVNFLESDQRLLTFEYEGRKLNALLGIEDDLLHTNIDFGEIPLLVKKFVPRALKLKLQQNVFRLAQFLDGGEFKNNIYRMFGAKIGTDVIISHDVYMDEVAPELITIGDGTLIGERAAVLAHEFSIKHARFGRVNIGRQVLIGAFATVRSGVNIGDRSVVAMNSFVNDDVPSGYVVGGVPAKKIKKQRHV